MVDQLHNNDKSQDYMKIEYALVEENSNLIEKIVFLNNYKLIAIKSLQPSLLFFFFLSI
jgi:hypothetical protein